MKTIILPTDFSSVAKNANRYAALLFEKTPCKFILLNAYFVPPAVIDVVGIADISTFEDQSKESLKTELESFKLLKHHPQTTFECIAEYGDIPQVIKKLAKNDSFDLIVMGTTGASGIKEVLMGSNTASVIKNSLVPILCIPKGKDYSHPKNILLTADYKSIKDENIISPLIEIAHSFKSTVSILHVTTNEDPEDISSDKALEAFNLHNSIEDLDHEFYSVHSQSIEAAIEDFANKMNIDLVVALKRKHPFLSRLFNASMTKRMAFHTQLPLLILPEKDS